MTLVAFESLAVTTILPEIEADLGGIAWYGWVTSAFFLGTMIGIVFAGDQANHRGAAPPYVVGLVLFAIGLAIGGFAPSMPILVVGRFVQGFGAGVVPAIGYVAIGRAFSVSERPRMFAILSTAWVVPGLIGPVLAERIADGVGWRWVFLSLLPLVAIAGALVVPAMMRLGPVADVDTTSVRFMRRRLVEAARVAAGAALVVAGLTFERWMLVPAFVAGLVVGLGPLRRLTPQGTLHAAAGLPAVIASRGLLTFAFFGLDAFVPYVITSGRDRSTFAASIAVTVATVSWTAATWIQQRWIGQLGEAWFVRVASLQLSDNLGVALGAGVVGAIVAFGDDVGWPAGDAVAIAMAVPTGIAVLGVCSSRAGCPGASTCPRNLDGGAGSGHQRTLVVLLLALHGALLLEGLAGLLAGVSLG